MISRGDLWWADLGAPVGSRPAKRRPVLVIQINDYNISDIATVVVAVVTSNTELAHLRGNVFLPAGATGLPRDSVVNVSQLLTVNKSDLTDPAGLVAGDSMRQVDAGLRFILGL